MSALAAVGIMICGDLLIIGGALAISILQAGTDIARAIRSVDEDEAA